ncbi:unnamed protein product [Rangifer tarandus platyrhynchus]|uniref:Uncharacterized protein n=1 Tax=Rangifer tarandus platyrhynchus TaxID=3082113 RepID=A0AC59Z275_RANTA
MSEVQGSTVLVEHSQHRLAVWSIAQTSAFQAGHSSDPDLSRHSSVALPVAVPSLLVRKAAGLKDRPRAAAHRLWCAAGLQSGRASLAVLRGPSCFVAVRVRFLSPLSGKVCSRPLGHQGSPSFSS